MDGAVVKALASHQCGPGSNPGVDAICELSLLLVLSFAPRGFSPGTPVFPSPRKPTVPNSNSIRNRVDEEPRCGCASSKSLVLLLLLLLLLLSLLLLLLLHRRTLIFMRIKVEIGIWTPIHILPDVCTKIFPWHGDLGLLKDCVKIENCTESLSSWLQPIRTSICESFKIKR